MSKYSVPKRVKSYTKVSRSNNENDSFFDNIKRLFIVGVACVLAGIVALKLYLAILPPIANLSDFKPNMVTKFLSSDGEVIKSFGEYPYRDEEERKRSGIIKSQVYQSSITIDPSGTRFMSCMYSGDLLEFYRITADSIYRTKKIYNHFPEYRFNESQVVVSRKSPTDYLGAVSTSKYIYLLYSGRTYEEFADRSFYGNRILVYDWEGNRIAELRSNKDLCALCLSSDSSMMYVLALDPNPVLAYFHLFDNYE